MKKILALLVAVFIAGCSTVVPVKMKFPDAPDTLKQKCEELKSMQDGATISDISKTVSENYTRYYECANKTEGWIDWYNAQKKIFEGVK